MIRKGLLVVALSLCCILPVRSQEAPSGPEFSWESASTSAGELVSGERNHRIQVLKTRMRQAVHAAEVLASSVAVLSGDVFSLQAYADAFPGSQALVPALAAWLETLAAHRRQLEGWSRSLEQLETQCPASTLLIPDAQRLLNAAQRVQAAHQEFSAAAAGAAETFARHGFQGQAISVRDSSAAAAMTSSEAAGASARIMAKVLRQKE